MNVRSEAWFLPAAEPPQRRWAPENTVVAAVCGAILLIFVLAALGMNALERSAAMAKRVAHTYEVIRQVDRAATGMSAVATSVQGYVLSGEETLLRVREQALSDAESSLRNLRELTVDNALQQEQVAELARLTALRISVSNSVLVARQTGGFAEAQILIKAARTQKILERVQAQQGAIIREEERLLAERQRNELESRHHVLVIAGALVALVVLIVGLGLGWLRRELDVRRRLTRSLETQRRFLESVVDHLPALIVIKDPQTLRFVVLNRAIEAWFGLPREQLIGRTAHDLLPTAEAEAVEATDRIALQQVGVLDLAVNERASRHTASVFRTQKLAVRDKDGRALFLVCISTDISARVADEQRIRALNEHLEEQKTALEAANRELESFSYSVSHDLRAPLRAIDGFSLMLLEDYGPKLDAEAQRYLATIRAGSQRMGQLIDDLLAFSRLSRQPLKRLTVDMEHLVGVALPEALTETTAATPTITVNTLPAASGDPVLLQHVWSNLLANAVKYSSRVAEPGIAVGSSRDGGEVVYYVRDNGAGFDMQYAHKLFGVFQRLHGQEEFPGTGVGLAIVHRVVTRHGGRVWAESVPGRGATFYFTLPGAADA